MLKRKIEEQIESHLRSVSDKIMIIEGARQVGKSYIIREVGKRLFPHFVEINFVRDAEGPKLFEGISTTEELYLTLGMTDGHNLSGYDDTLVFLDEIQQYPQYFTLLKFLREDHRYHFIASGSQLGITLRTTTSLPIGSVLRVPMHQLDFEEFLVANGVGEEFLEMMRSKFAAQEPLTETFHEHVMNLWKRYLLVGGMPDAVNEYLASHNIVRVREIHQSIHRLYGDDAAKYERDSGRNLQVRRIYDMVPSQMENKKKRIVAKDISGKKGDRFDRYQEEFEYLISSGVTLDVHAISNPRFPLAESVQKNLLKLYLNDVGMLTAQLYRNNIQPIISDERSVNIGAVYESVVAQELKSHGHNLFYYDNRKMGEVDFLVDDYANTSLLPIEVKSGKDYTVHSALNRLLSVDDYNIHHGIVFNNRREVHRKGKVVYMPVYYVMFINANEVPTDMYI